MKKIVLVSLVALVMGACGFLPTSPVNPTLAVVVESPTSPPTDTPTALPTETSVPVTETFASTPEVLLNPTITPLTAADLTTTPVDAATVVIDTATPVSFPSSATPSPTLGVLTYGTLPPAVPFNTVKLWNKAKVEAYISLQQQEGGAILEYPVKGQIYVDIPLGQYIYVAWVGGNKMTGSFKVGAFDSIDILIFKNRIVIERS